MDYERFRAQEAPVDGEVVRRVEETIAGYRAEPAELRLRVGERYSILKVRPIPIDHSGRALKWQGHRIDGIADSGVARLEDQNGDIEALAPGTTHLALTPGHKTAAGEYVTVQVKISVRPA